AAERRDEAGELEVRPDASGPIGGGGSPPGGLVDAAPDTGAGPAAAVLIKPLPGLLVGLLPLAALLRARWRVVLAIGAPVALGLAALYVLLEQTLNEYPPVFEWPTFFDRVHVLGWLAVVLIAADALVEVVRTRRRRRADTSDRRDSTSG